MGCRLCWALAVYAVYAVHAVFAVYGVLFAVLRLAAKTARCELVPAAAMFVARWLLFATPAAAWVVGAPLASTISTRAQRCDVRMQDVPSIVVGGG